MIIIIIELLKSEPKVKKENMSDRYEEISLDKLKTLEIQYGKLRKKIYHKIENIHLSITNFDYDM